MKEYSFICECWDNNSKKVVREDAAETSTALLANTIGVVSGVGGIVLRNKRHRIVFEKTMKKFPHAKDMVVFLSSRGLNPKGLTPNTPDHFYMEWVKREIVKEGRFWRILGQVLFFGLAGGAYNAIRYSLDNNKDADELVTRSLN